MHIKGFYKPTNCRYDVFEFLATNMLGLAKYLCFAEPIKLFFLVYQNPCLDQVQLAAWNNIPILYNEKIRVVKAFTVFTDQTARDYLKTLDRSKLQFSLWELIFHEVRHFIQQQLFKNRLSQCCRVRDFTKILESNPQLAKRFKPYKDLPYQKRRQEIDALVVAYYCALWQMKTYDGYNFDFDTIIKMLSQPGLSKPPKQNWKKSKTKFRKVKRRKIIIFNIDNIPKNLSWSVP